MAELNQKLINYEGLEHFRDLLLNDTGVTTGSTWSSEKINSEISAIAGTANPEIEGKESIDFIFVAELPASGETDAYVIINGENVDTLYKYVEGEWVVQTPDANKLYFDTENEALYSYVTAEHQFAPVSMVNTIVVGSNLNSNTALKAIKTPGVYSVVQRLHNATKGDYVKNWTLTVESVDYEEYDRSDSIYQKLVNNYTIQKRTWSATRASNDGWSSFSTYYAGEIKDSTTSKYYTWSSNKISTELANIPQLEAGENISVEDGKINALGYKAGISMTSSFVELPYTKFEPYIDLTSQLPTTDLYFTGDAGATTYTVSGQFVPMLSQAIGYAFQVGNGNIATLLSYDSSNSVATFDKSLDDSNALSNAQMSKIYVIMQVTFSGAANATTYTYVDISGGLFTSLVKIGRRIKIGDYDLRTITGKSSNSITLNETLDSDNAVSNAEFIYMIEDNNTADGAYSHAEGNLTKAYGGCSHVEGVSTTASGDYSHAEGCRTTAYDYSSHAEGEESIASGYCSHSEGYMSISQNNTEHAEGRYNVSHTVNSTYGNSGNTQHSIGVGSGNNSRANAVEIMQNGDMYIKGIGGYQGTDTKVQDNAIKTLQEYILSLEARINALEGNTTVL